MGSKLPRQFIFPDVRHRWRERLFPKNLLFMGFVLLPACFASCLSISGAGHRILLAGVSEGRNRGGARVAALVLLGTGSGRFLLGRANSFTPLAVEKLPELGKQGLRCPKKRLLPPAPTSCPTSSIGQGTVPPPPRSLQTPGAPSQSLKGRTVQA